MNTVDANVARLNPGIRLGQPSHFDSFGHDLIVDRLEERQAFLFCGQGLDPSPGLLRQGGRRRIEVVQEPERGFPLERVRPLKLSDRIERSDIDLLRGMDETPLALCEDEVDEGVESLAVSGKDLIG